ncbi:hypothetical protein RND71_012717 [Anisodus tanguticus]|uniref:Uncharacterized protein n=1 Tax=Anisodus tanguticus TaxID=243964 RepID=A0AAE1SF62_9SOLA|nr:hypothetical protein RND71_012717 [Anisodus tanguticus]
MQIPLQFSKKNQSERNCFPRVALPDQWDTEEFQISLTGEQAKLQEDPQGSVEKQRQQKVSLQQKRSRKSSASKKDVKDKEETEVAKDEKDVDVIVYGIYKDNTKYEFVKKIILKIWEPSSEIFTRREFKLVGLSKLTSLLFSPIVGPSNTRLHLAKSWAPMGNSRGVCELRGSSMGGQVTRPQQLSFSQELGSIEKFWRSIWTSRVPYECSVHNKNLNARILEDKDIWLVSFWAIASLSNEENMKNNGTVAERGEVSGMTALGGGDTMIFGYRCRWQGGTVAGCDRDGFSRLLTSEVAIDGD